MENTGGKKFTMARGRVLMSANILLFVVALLINIISFQRLNICDNTNCSSSIRRHLQGISQHYPLAELSRTLMRFDAELGAPSVFKGQPRKELDDAWGAIVDQPMILVNKETLEAYDPTSKPSKSKSGHYYATVEVYHQLHCLDITREFIWRDHYQHVDTFQDPPEMVWERVDHCIDLLRQVLMFNADTGLIFYTHMGQLQPAARVSINHMCRKFSHITDWVNSHDSERDDAFAELT
ncbi:hypothetical protein QBC35DRAFT_385399 [Podospora australis]|uniref:Uncharacterized protein n=1 Tax=Podospora australis TaxID=1536484 RepID=A0AAN7AFZ4_9PEZI|nr:hypothetical protein QBC35DRAFT_385399 [Podospora australis]